MARSMHIWVPTEQVGANGCVHGSVPSTAPWPLQLRAASLTSGWGIQGDSPCQAGWGRASSLFLFERLFFF